MTTLSPELRKQLERAVVRARVVAEVGAVGVVSRLGVGVRDAPPYLDEGERALRVALRARGRQLGDGLDHAGESDVRVSCRLLVGEVAFEQWHRLLFARFLEANGLLVHPQHKVAVSLGECEELAAGLGEPDGWSVAAQFASEVLPGIFRPSDPCAAVRLAPEDLAGLEQVLAGLPKEVFTSEDGLGWVYQFWQSQAKAEVNASGRKIGGADLAPVTQLFTENYMVRFLLENSLGAWWAARHPESPLVAGWEFLRTDEDGSPAAGSFTEWPERVADVRVMDPCCGSGHFLVAAFGMLWRMRAEEEALSPADAQDAVLRENLFGLELDPRCTQIAMFALALEAWKAGGFRQLPTPQVACSGIPARVPLSEWTKLAQGDPQLEGALARLHALFAEADTLGSLIDPVRAAEQGGLDSVDWHQVAPLLQKALTAEADATGDPAAEVFGEAATGIARAADYLSRTYTLVTTNPPYLGRPKQSLPLMEYCQDTLVEGRHDLANSMMLRWAGDFGHTAMSLVMPQAWTFQPRSEDLRRFLLSNSRLRFVAWLGEGAFASPAAAGAFAMLVLLSTNESGGSYCALSLQTKKGLVAKSEGLASETVNRLNQLEQMGNPDARILGRAVTGPSIGEVARSHQGIKTGDNPRFLRTFWEFGGNRHGWQRIQTGPLTTSMYTGCESLVFFEDGYGVMSTITQAGATFRGRAAWGVPGLVINAIRNLYSTVYTGEVFDAQVITPNHPRDLAALWCFAESADFADAVRAIDSGLVVNTSTLSQITFDVKHWRQVAAERYPDGLPEPLSDDPSQWLFRGVPEGSTEPLQVAVGRLVGFRWPDQESDAVDGMVDADGVVCLPAAAGEQAAAERVRAVLAASYGDGWSSSVLDELLVAAGGKAGDLEGWLRDTFFKHHCKVFANRPFVWHIWDGRKDGFSALVNYHRLDKAGLSKLTYTTLGWWIERQRADVEAGVAGAEPRLAAAAELQRKLALILEGEPPFDIYVRWKSLAEQPLGWDPDLDDGVRLNIRPFVTAGVLRHKFTIHWKKDRGTNPDGSERHNDLHHTLGDKHRARGTK